MCGGCDLKVNETQTTLDLLTGDGIGTARQRLSADVACQNSGENVSRDWDVLWVNEVRSARTAAESFVPKQGGRVILAQRPTPDELAIGCKHAGEKVEALPFVYYNHYWKWWL